jgi:WD40 repeat protein
VDQTLRLWEVGTGQCARTVERQTEGISAVTMSADGRWILSGASDGTLRLRELDWDYDFPAQSDWDDGAKGCLETFLTLHRPLSADGLTRVGEPVWNDGDFQELVKNLQLCGFGWLRPEGIQEQLKMMAG